MPIPKFLKSLTKKGREKKEKEKLLKQFLKSAPERKTAKPNYRAMDEAAEKSILRQVTKHTKQKDSAALIKHVISFSPRIREKTVRSLRIILHKLPNEKLDAMVIPLLTARNILCGGHNLAIRKEITMLLESIKEKLGKSGLKQ